MEMGSSPVIMGWTGGEQYSGAELSATLTDAGFQDIEIKPTFGYYSVVTASKPCSAPAATGFSVPSKPLPRCWEDATLSWGRGSRCGLAHDAQRGAQRAEVGRSEDDAIPGGDIDKVEVHPGPSDLASQVGQYAGTVLDIDHHDLALTGDREMRDRQ